MAAVLKQRKRAPILYDIVTYMVVKELNARKTDWLPLGELYSGLARIQPDIQSLNPEILMYFTHDPFTGVVSKQVYESIVDGVLWIGGISRSDCVGIAFDEGRPERAQRILDIIRDRLSEENIQKVEELFKMFHESLLEKKSDPATFNANLIKRLEMQGNRQFMEKPEELKPMTDAEFKGRAKISSAMYGELMRRRATEPS